MSHGKTYSEEEALKEEAREAAEEKLKQLEKEKQRAMADEKKKQKQNDSDQKAKVLAADKAKGEKFLNSTSGKEVSQEILKLGKETTAQKESDEKAKGVDPKKSADTNQQGKTGDEPKPKEKEKDAAETKKDDKPREKPTEKEKNGSEIKKDDKTKKKSNEKDIPHDKRLVKREQRKKLTEIEKVAHVSFENCAKACDATPECFQYVHHEKECKLGHSFRLGKYSSPGRGDRILWRSGWNVTRIRKWTEENLCEGPQWPDWAGSAE